MIKTLIASGVAVSAVVLGSPAIAGPYANVENNAGYQDGYQGSTTDLHVGYEGPIGESASYYVQAGASVVSPDGAAADTVPSGKAGLSVAATENLGVYGEVSFVGSGVAGVDRGYGTKAGVKYSF